MAKLKVPATGAVLAWARKSAGFSPEDAAKRVSEATAAETIIAWENGEEQPTLPQLRKLAEAYRRPLSLFFLSDLPTGFQPMHDFRRQPGEVAHTYSPNLMLEMRLANERRALALELLEDAGEAPPPFRLRAQLGDNVEELGAQVRRALGVTLAEQTLSKHRNNSFGYWRRKIEALGVLVFQADRTDLAEMLGFSIAGETLPVIVVNRKNKRGRVFTLLHEFVHLMLRRGGICDLEDEHQRHAAEQRIETYCNAVAGAALLPASDLLAESVVADKGSVRADFDMPELDLLSNRYGVSALVVMRRLLTLRRTTQEFYREKQLAYGAIYARLDKRARESAADQEIKRNMPVETIAKLGPQFIRLVLDTYHNERMTLSEVSDHLGVRVRHIAKIDEQVRAGE